MLSRTSGLSVAFHCVGNLELVFIDWRWSDEDDVNIVRVAFDHSDEDFQIFSVFRERHVLVRRAVRQARVICAEEDSHEKDFSLRVYRHELWKCD